METAGTTPLPLYFNTCLLSLSSGSGCTQRMAETQSFVSLVYICPPVCACVCVCVRVCVCVCVCTCSHYV